VRYLLMPASTRKCDLPTELAKQTECIPADSKYATMPATRSAIPPHNSELKVARLRIVLEFRLTTRLSGLPLSERHAVHPTAHEKARHEGSSFPCYVIDKIQY
jgi:hypothetical protein